MYAHMDLKANHNKYLRILYNVNQTDLHSINLHFYIRQLTDKTHTMHAPVLNAYCDNCN